MEQRWNGHQPLASDRAGETATAFQQRQRRKLRRRGILLKSVPEVPPELPHSRSMGGRPKWEVDIPTVPDLDAEATLHHHMRL